MNKSLLLLVAVVPLLGLALASPAALAENTSGAEIPAAPELPTDARRGRAIADHAEFFDSGWVDQYSQARMTLFAANGDSVRREIRQLVREGGDGDKSVVRFMSPAEIRGVAALTHEHPGATDDSWLYLPATRRVRRISGANRTASFQGTEFTYEDLTSASPERYRWSFQREASMNVDGASVPVYQVEARPTYRDTGYQRLEFSFHRDNFRVERIVFYDRAGERLKTLTASRWREHHGRFWRARRLDMENHQTGKRTRIETTSMFLNMSLYPRRDGTPRQNLTDRQFTRTGLENG